VPARGSERGSPYPETPKPKGSNVFCLPTILNHTRARHRPPLPGGVAIKRRRRMRAVLPWIPAERRQAEESGSFLKKRTKKRLTLWAERPRPRRSQNDQNCPASFFQ
jgi:hypothetical protein